MCDTCVHRDLTFDMQALTNLLFRSVVPSGFVLAVRIQRSLSKNRETFYFL